MGLFLATTDDGNRLLEDDPLALLLGMLLDQQITMEKAFTSPSVLAQRLGVSRLSAADLATMDPPKLTELFATPPALHRFPANMAQRTQALCRVLVAEYDGDPAAVWTEASSGSQLVGRIAALPGFGEQKAKIFAALLAKQFGIRPAGWQDATGDYGAAGSYRSVADVVDEESRNKVRAFKKEMKAKAKAKAAGG